MTHPCIWFKRYGDPQCGIPVSTGYLCSIHDQDSQFKRLNEKLMLLDRLEKTLSSEVSQCQTTANYFQISGTEVRLMIDSHRKRGPPPLPPRPPKILEEKIKPAAQTEDKVSETTAEVMKELESIVEANGGPKAEEVEKAVPPGDQDEFVQQLRAVKLKPVTKSEKAPEKEPNNIAQMIKKSMETKFKQAYPKEEEE
jgi:hypothetical protein